MPVETRELTLNLTKEASEIGECLTKIVESTLEAISDGWQAGEDIPKILVDSLNPLITAIAGFEKLPMEYKENLEGFIYGLTIPTSKIPFLIVDYIKNKNNTNQ